MGGGTYEAERAIIKSAFSVFDRDEKGEVPKDDVGTIMRYLGVFPSEEEVERDVVPRVAEGDVVRYERFEPMMLDCIVRRRYEPDSEETLLQAYRVLDKEGSGSLSEAVLVEALTSNELAFRPEELEDFLRFAKDPDTGLVHYEDVVNATLSSQ